MGKNAIARGLTCVCMVMGVLLVFPTTKAMAAEDSLGYKIFQFGGGFVSAFLIHEASHEVVALATDTGMSWRLGDMNQPLAFKEGSSTSAAGFAINSSGLIIGAVGAEVILRNDNIDKNDSFVRGMMLWSILNPITYVIDYWFIHRTNSTSGSKYQGDIQGIERYSNKTAADVFSATLLAVAAFQGYRYARTQTWAPDWLKGKEFDNVTLAPLPTGGALLSYTMEF